MKEKNLIKKTLIYLIGNVSSKLLSVVLVPLYAFYINASQLGSFDYSQTLVNVIVPIAFMAIWEADLKFLLSSNEKKVILQSSTCFVFIQTIVIVILLIIYNMIKPIEYVQYLLFMIITTGIAYIWQYYARGLEKNKLYVMAGVIGTIVNFIVNIILICICNIKIDALYIGNILGNIAIIMIIEKNIKVIKEISLKKVNVTILKKMLKFSAPLVVNLISVWLISGMSKVIITRFIGVNMNGLYAFANKFSIIVTFLGTVLSMAITEETIISVNAKENSNNEFSTTIEFVFEKFLYALILALPIINVFYHMISSTEYYASKEYFSILLYYALLMNMSTNIGTIFQAINKTKYISISTVMGAGLTLIISFSCIKIIGIYAVIVGQIFGATLMMIMRYIFAKKIEKIKIIWNKILFLTIIYIIVSILCYKSNIIVNIIIFITILIFVIFVHKSYIKEMVEKLKERKKYDKANN